METFESAPSRTETPQSRDLKSCASEQVRSGEILREGPTTRLKLKKKKNRPVCLIFDLYYEQKKQENKSG